MSRRKHPYPNVGSCARCKTFQNIKVSFSGASEEHVPGDQDRSNSHLFLCSLSNNNNCLESS